MHNKSISSVQIFAAGKTTFAKDDWPVNVDEHWQRFKINFAIAASRFHWLTDIFFSCPWIGMDLIWKRVTLAVDEANVAHADNNNKIRWKLRRKLQLELKFEEKQEVSNGRNPINLRP